jgi:hypothetical protein
MIVADMPALLETLLRSEAPGSPLRRYMVITGSFYVLFGLGLLAWPQQLQVVLGEPAFAGGEQNLMRLVGLLVVVIGTFQVISGRADQRTAIATSIVLRLVPVPIVLVVLGASGVFPRATYAFAVIDPVLAAGAWHFLARARP